MRSFTIDAENEEEFIKEYEKAKKSRLSQLNFVEKNEDGRISEVDEEELSPTKKKKIAFHFNNEEEDEYAGLGMGAFNNDNDEEDLLGPENEDDDIIRESEDNLIRNDHSEDKGIELLCYYLRNTVMGQANNVNNNEIIFNKNKNIRALSGNAIYDLNMRELVDNILAENDNEYTKPTEGNNNSLRDYIFQNIESDCTLKIMFMSNNKNTKNSFISKFFDEKNNSNKNEKEELTDEAFDIRKKQIKLFNKNISLKIFDTSDQFHKNSISTIYYKTVSAFFIFIESSKNNVKEYLDFIFNTINKYTLNKTVVIFGINMLFREDCTIDGVNLREFSADKDALFIPISLNNFDLKNSVIINLLNLILIKGIDHKINLNSLRKGSKDKGLGGIKNKLTDKINDSSQKKNLYDISKMNIQSTLGYKKKYRIKHINAFDINEDDFDKRIKRKLSVDI